MKIDKRSPRHWFYLSLFLCNVLMALVLRPFFKRQRRKLVILYGHKLNGNLLALYRARDRSAFEMVFLTMDPLYHRELKATGQCSLLASSFGAIAALVGASAIISDHGLHAMSPLLYLSDIKFFDVWHGIPFKGFDADDFRSQRRYTEIWVASPLLAKMYVERFGFRSEQVVATGYARTDRLVAPTENVGDLRARLGLPVDRPVVLFAPTWAQDDAGRSIFPFDSSPAEFFAALSQLARWHGATVVLRTHLNSGDQKIATPPDVIVMSASREPDTEAILLASDVLVCDWSSIAFDFLLLDRPAVFLDVPAPFRNGFSLGPEYRYGAAVPDIGTMIHWIEICITDPQVYWKCHSTHHAYVKQVTYSDRADGHGTARCLERLGRQLAGKAN